jgi:hypothetical protein
MIEYILRIAQSQNRKKDFEVKLKGYLPRGRRWEEFKSEKLGEGGNRWRDLVVIWPI